MVKQNAGIVPMRTVTGIRSFYQSLASGKDQLMVLEGDLGKFRASFLAALPAQEAGKPITAIKNKTAPRARPTIGENPFREKAENYFKKLLSSVIKLPVERIEADDTAGEIRDQFH